MDSRPWQRWALLALCLVAFALRLGPLWANRFHPDEALYASWGLLIRTGRDVWLSNQSADKPPVLFYLMAVSFHSVWRSEVAARLPGLVAGTLGVPLVFQVLNPRPHGPTLQAPQSGFPLPNWVAAVLMAFSPYAISFSPTAFLDPLMVTFALAACVAATRGRAGWAGVLLGLSAATKLTGLLFLPLVMGSQVAGYRMQEAGFKSGVLKPRFWAGVLGVMGLVIVWDRIKGGPPFWVQQTINYNGLYLVSLSDVLSRLRAWLAFLPYFFGWPVLVVIAGLALASLLPTSLLLSPQRFAEMILGFLCGSPCLLRAALRKEGDGLNSCPTPSSRRSTRGMLLAFGMLYLAVHWLLAFQVWDRYLLGLVPIAALWAGQLLASFASRGGLASLARPLIVGLLIILLLPSALTAACSGYPIGGDHGAYDGIDQVADYLRARPEGTVVYDHWLGWEFKYYLWDARAYVAYFPTPGALRDDLRAFGSATPRYVTVPAYATAQPVLEAVAQAGFYAQPVLATINRRNQPTFTVYRITPQP